MHRLTDRDIEARTAVCAVCGPTRIFPKGPAGWRCIGPRRASGLRRSRAAGHKPRKPPSLDRYRSVKRDGKWVAEHRWIMEQVLGRPLLAFEEVHHRNGLKGDNRPENLELWSTSQPRGQRVIDKLEWAREILALYGP